MTSYKVAIIGAGHSAKDLHLPAWAGVAGTKVVGICDVDAARAEGVARQYEIPHYGQSAEHLLRVSGADIVDICTPPNTHLEFLRLALSAGKHAIVEKPMSMSREEMSVIIELAADAECRGRAVGVIHNMLFDPPVLQARRMLDRRYDDILGVRVELLGTPQDALLADSSHWCHKLAGGRIGENLVHPVYVLQHFLGGIQPIGVTTAKRGTYPWVRADELHVSFAGGNRFGDLYISFNAPRSETNVRIYTRREIIDAGGFSWTCLVSPMKRNTPFMRAVDGFARAGQLWAATSRNVLMSSMHRFVPSHRAFFRSFVEGIKEGSSEAINWRQACNANCTYLRLLDSVVAKTDETGL